MRAWLFATPTSKQQSEHQSMAAYEIALIAKLNSLINFTTLQSGYLCLFIQKMPMWWASNIKHHTPLSGDSCKRIEQRTTTRPIAHKAHAFSKYKEVWFDRRRGLTGSMVQCVAHSSHVSYSTSHRGWTLSKCNTMSFRPREETQHICIASLAGSDRLMVDTP